MKVTNPNPCLVNVAVDGDYVRIGPNQTADVPEKAVAALVKSGALVAEKSASKAPAAKASGTEKSADEGGKTAGGGNTSGETKPKE